MDLRLLADDLEAVSRLYAEQFGIDRDDNWFMLKLQEEVGELTQAFLMRAGQARDKGLSPGELDRAFRAELSDVLAQVLIMARHFDVDVQVELEHKWLSRNPDWVRRAVHPCGSHPSPVASPQPDGHAVGTPIVLP
jgi:NTP pyrophosphatase (non-canonical NTP hydrolase)